jgi:YesN/AraC family two-component response regulator
MEREKVYLNPTIDRNTLVGMLGTNRKHLYEAIKIVGKTNLSHILNRYRVFEAKKIIHEHCLAGNQQDLPDDIFNRAGFIAKTTYYRTFKKLTGITPMEYLNELSKSRSDKGNFLEEEEEKLH